MGFYTIEVLGSAGCRERVAFTNLREAKRYAKKYADKASTVIGVSGDHGEPLSTWSAGRWDDY